MVYWRIFVVATDGYHVSDTKEASHFVSDHSYHDLVLRVGAFLLNLVAQGLSFPDRPHCADEQGERWLECLFGQARAGHGCSRTFTINQLAERLRRGMYRVRTQLRSGLIATNSAGKRLDAKGRSEAERPPTLRAEMGGGDVSPAALHSLIAAASKAAFKRLRADLHELGMAETLIKAGRVEIELEADPIGFELAVLEVESVVHET